MDKYYVLRSHEDTDTFLQTDGNYTHLVDFDKASMFLSLEDATYLLIKCAKSWYDKGYLINLVEIDLAKNTITTIR